MKNKEFEICVRAVIYRNGKILVCKRKDRGYYFFPGGHVEFGENAKEALIRELKEELNITVQGISFMGSMENIYQEDSQIRHEINLVFSVRAKEAKDRSAEDHLNFYFFDIKQFTKKRVFPIALKEQVLKWLKNKKIFWINQG